MGAPRAVSAETLGAWLVKASPAQLPHGTGASLDPADLTTRCVRPTYRTGLVRAGQPVLLWLSGRDPRHPAGIHAHGHVTGPVCEVPGEEPVLTLRLRATEPTVLRADVLAHPVLGGLEVVRMPAGSNPSFLDVRQYRALCEAFPQVAVG